MTESEALRHVNRLAAFFPHVPVETRAAYASGLVDFEDSDLAEAVSFFAARAERFPSLREIRSHVLAERPAQLFGGNALPPAELAAAAPDEIRAIVAAYFERVKAPGLPEPTPDPQAIAALEEMRRDPTGRLRVVPNSAQYEPEYVQDGPPCGGCGRPMYRDGGPYWFCGACGWLTRRIERGAKAL